MDISLHSSAYHTTLTICLCVRVGCSFLSRQLHGSYDRYYTQAQPETITPFFRAVAAVYSFKWIETALQAYFPHKTNGVQNCALRGLQELHTMLRSCVPLRDEQYNILKLYFASLHWRLSSIELCMPQLVEGNHHPTACDGLYTCLPQRMWYHIFVVCAHLKSSKF